MTRTCIYLGQSSQSISFVLFVGNTFAIGLLDIVFGYLKVDARIRFARGAELKVVSLLNHTCDKQMHDTMEDGVSGVFRSCDSKPRRVCNMASVASM